MIKTSERPAVAIGQVYEDRDHRTLAAGRRRFVHVVDVSASDNRVMCVPCDVLGGRIDGRRTWVLRARLRSRDYALVSVRSSDALIASAGA